MLTNALTLLFLKFELWKSLVHDLKNGTIIWEILMSFFYIQTFMNIFLVIEILRIFFNIWFSKNLLAKLRI